MCPGPQRRGTAGEDKYASRTIDLDLLVYGDLVVSNNELTLPHPDILKRAFVAIPLAESSPELVLPGSGVPVQQVAEQFSTDGMQPLDVYTHLLRNEFCRL